VPKERHSSPYAKASIGNEKARNPIDSSTSKLTFFKILTIRTRANGTSSRETTAEIRSFIVTLKYT
jgi:hypothetical protein